jgi:hypothetical protein
MRGTGSSAAGGAAKMLPARTCGTVALATTRLGGEVVLPDIKRHEKAPRHGAVA